MYIPQVELEQLKSLVSPGKVVIVFGPRRVGKTTLLKHYLSDKSNYLFVTGEDIFVSSFLSSNSIEKLKEFVGDKTLLVIDEAQYIPSIGQNLKLIVDHIPQIQVIATGSSSFDLAKQVGEPLTGRKSVIKMYPISQIELNQIENRAEVLAHLETRMIYGSYPEVITFSQDSHRQEHLHELVSSYLLKDILAFEGIQKSKKYWTCLYFLPFKLEKRFPIANSAPSLV